MKTLAVLSTLVGLAIAAPSQLSGFQQPGLPQKSLHGLAAAPIDFNAEINGPPLSARNHHGFKNPVIVKTKSGTHLYRDSAEERANADPNESCGKQVRVKFCNDAVAKSTDLRRSAKDEKLENEENVVDSIKLAKEAVESLQQDLQTIDATNGKSAQWKHGEADKDLHEDIEAARAALEQAQRKFGNLESMNLRATTLRDSEALNGQNIGKTQEERIAQWKTVMENIQRNVEIARNIEDSFKAADHSSLFNAEPLDTTKFMRNSNQAHNAVLHKTATRSSSVLSTRSTSEKNTDKTTLLSNQETMSIGKNAENFEADMKSAASEPVNVKHGDNDGKHHNLKVTQPKLAQVSSNIKPLVNADINTPLTKKPGVKLDITSRNANSETQMPGHHKSTPSNTMHSDSAHKVTLNMQQAKNAEKDWDSHAADKTMKHEKSAWIETDNKDMMLKSAEHNVGLINLGQDKQDSKIELDTHSMKSAEFSAEQKNEKNDAEQLAKQSELSLHTDMKLADNTQLASEISLNAPQNIQLNHGVSPKTDDAKLGKSVDEAIEQARVVGYHKHGHHEPIDHHVHHVHHVPHGHHDIGHDFHGQHHGGYGHKYGHHHHGKNAEFDSVMHPSMQIDMKELSEKSAMEDMIQWKHHHDAARASYGLGGYGGDAYGAGAYGGSGHIGAAFGSGSYGGGHGSGSYGGGHGSAVGVFPHAKIGGCGIPLLLSCSPSVVSGSLAKSHGYAAPAAAAPAYRHEEESNTKIKRDIIKTKETSIKKVKDVTKSTKSKDFDKKLMI